MQQTTLPFPSYSDPQSSLHLIISSSNKRDLILETFKVRYWCKVSRFVKKMCLNCLLIITSCTNGWPTNWELSAAWWAKHILTLVSYPAQRVSPHIIFALDIQSYALHCAVWGHFNRFANCSYSCNYRLKADESVLGWGLTQTRI